jgi:hypothetical protein
VKRACLLLAGLQLLGVVGWAVPAASAGDERPRVGTAHPANSAEAGSLSATAGAGPVVIVVVGAAGKPEYAPQFAAWAELWKQACEKSHAEFIAVGLDANNTASDRATLQQILADRVAGVPPALQGQDALDTEATAALWLVLIGHGTFDGRTAKFNLRGPDVSARELAEWLKPVRRPVAVIDTTSSSAPFLKELSAPGRIVITATQSGFEQSYARFGQYLAAAILAPQADLDKDGQTSLLEAFLSASHAVSEFYSAAGRLATEHALLDDNGDGLGTPADWFRGLRPVQKPGDNASLDGHRAHQLHLLYSSREAAMPPELRARRDQLELAVLALRDAKASFPEAEYYSQLEALLTEMARLYEQIDKSGTAK